MTVRPPARPVRTTLAGELRRRGAWHDQPDRLRRKQQSPPEPGRYSRPAGPHLDSAARVSGQKAGRSGCGRLGPNRRAGRLARCTWLSGKASESWLRISNYASELGGAMGIRTPDLLHAMKATPSPPPALTRRDQQKQRRGATQSDAEQRPQTLICYPDRYPRHARSAFPRHRPRRTMAALQCTLNWPDRARLCRHPDSQYAERTPGATACRGAHPGRAGRCPGRPILMRGRCRRRSGSTPGLCRGRRLGGILIRHEQRRFTTGSRCGGLSARRVQLNSAWQGSGHGDVSELR
jgi:hypothetical protein